MSIIHLRAYTRYLSSIALLSAVICLAQSKPVSLGSVSLQTVAVSKDGSSRMAGGIIVRFFSKKRRAESFVLSSDAGIQVVPLRPGRYCYEGFSAKGEPLELIRPSKERCFTVRPGQLVEVGVEFKR